MQIIEKYKKNLLRKKLPKQYVEESLSLLNNSYWEFRKWYINNVGYALLSDKWISLLADYLKDKRCLEIMAGTGALSYFLRQKDVFLITTDNHSWRNDNWENRHWATIEEIDAVEAIKKYGVNIDYIIMSWPPYDNPIAYNCLIAIKETNPDIKIIYIGEGPGGCTGDDKFHETAIWLEDEKIENINQYFQRFDGLHDYVALLEVPTEFDKLY